jgi:hypothetical protein
VRLDLVEPVTGCGAIRDHSALRLPQAIVGLHGVGSGYV